MPQPDDLQRRLVREALKLTRVVAESDLTKVKKKKLLSLSEELVEITFDIANADPRHRGGILKNLISILTHIIQSLC